MKTTKPTILVIFGISGDLAKRYLLPSLKVLKDANMLPVEFETIGITRQENSEFFTIDSDNQEDYEKLHTHLKKIEENFSTPGQRLFYLSVPPEASRDVIEQIGKSSLIRNKEDKILLEKPFGTNLQTANELVKHIETYFDGDQVYRIDHYLAKDTAQNIITFRDGNSLFKKTWNRDFIESIEITMSESIGIEHRAHFYEQTGALRDMVQSHLLQLLALTLMELPDMVNFDDVPKLRCEALKNLNLACNIKEGGNSKCVKRGQYEGYRQEVQNQKSVVETFVSIKLESSDPRWQGVPIILSTGKEMKERFAGIKIKYKKEHEHESNQLLIRIQPDEGIEFSMWTKIPGFEHKTEKKVLKFLFKEHYGNLPLAYEQVLFNAINGDHSLFTSSAEVLETWRILDIVQEDWQHKTDDLFIYKKGTDIAELI